MLSCRVNVVIREGYLLRLRQRSASVREHICKGFNGVLQNSLLLSQFSLKLLQNAHPTLNM